MRTLFTLTAAALLATAITGCSSTGPAAVPASSTAAATSSIAAGAASGSAADQVTGLGTATTTPSKEAWTRGTHVIITNETGAPVEVGAGPVGNDPPDFPAAALAAGDALTAEDGSGTTGSSIGARITYPDGKVAEIRLVNPIIGTPEADWRTGPSDVDWVNGEQNYASLDEGESATASVEGHTIRFNRLADDDDNKNWTVSLA